MNWPTVGILIPTYNRPQIVGQCVAHLLENLEYPGTLHVFVGNDGVESPELPKTEFRSNREVAVIEGPKQGLGANLNHLLKTALYGCPIVLQLDDDHLLVKKLDLAPHVNLLLSDESVGCIRLMGIAAHRYIAHLEGSYWNIQWDSPELYIASNRPHLKHFRFHSSYGYYPEGLKLGHTEEAFCSKCKDTFREMGGPKVLVPLDVMTESSWQHIGDSWQLKGF